jgi:NAD(P)-dependent dehydrogenase (short-subunit alcohol dehydrogenase family)
VRQPAPSTEQPKESTTTTTWLITGATSGFGRLTADRAIAGGAHVLAVGRRSEPLAELAATAPAGQVTPIALDVTAPDSERAIAEAIAAAGRLDVLVNNAGYGLFGSVEQTPDEEVRAIFETSVIANLAVLRASLPALRESRGRIVLLASLVGQFAWPSSGVYFASKAAVEMFGEALAVELAPTGVKVTIMEPGVYATGFIGSAHVVAPDDTYAPTVGQFLQAAPSLPAGDPDLVADAIVAVVAMDEPPLRLAVGADAIGGIRSGLQAREQQLDAAELFTPVGAR